MKHKIGEFASLFPTPVVVVNIGQSFTKDEADCFANIPMWRDKKGGMRNHRSKDAYLFERCKII